MTKSGTLGWFLNKIGYLFSHDGARLRTPAKRLQIAFWRLNSLRLVYTQHPKPFFRRSNPQNGANDGPQKVLSTDNPILFRNTPGIVVVVVVVLTFTRMIKSVVTGQAPVTLELRNTPGKTHTQPKVVRGYITADAIHASTRNI